MQSLFYFFKLNKYFFFILLISINSRLPRDLYSFEQYFLVFNIFNYLINIVINGPLFFLYSLHQSVLREHAENTSPIRQCSTLYPQMSSRVNCRFLISCTFFEHSFGIYFCKFMEIKQIPFHIYEKEAHMKIKQFPHPLYIYIYIYIYIYSPGSQVTIFFRNDLLIIIRELYKLIRSQSFIFILK